MPSPSAHTAMGYLIYRVARRGQPGLPEPKIGPLPKLFVFAAVASLLPDLDAVVGLVLGDFGRYHNNGSHSLLVGLLMVLLVGGVVWFRQKAGFIYWSVLTFVAYNMHVVMDAFTGRTRGVMLFWPLSDERFAAPFTLFYGVRWSEGLWSSEHLLTLISEFLFVLLVMGVTDFVSRKTQPSTR